MFGVSPLCVSQPPLAYGAAGLVEGPSSDGEGVALKVKNLFDAVVDVSAADVSRTEPPPPDLSRLFSIMYGLLAFMLFTLALSMWFLWSEALLVDDEPMQPTSSRPVAAPAITKDEARDVVPPTPVSKTYPAPAKSSESDSPTTPMTFSTDGESRKNK